MVERVALYCRVSTGSLATTAAPPRRRKTRMGPWLGRHVPTPARGCSGAAIASSVSKPRPRQDERPEASHAFPADERPPEDEAGYPLPAARRPAWVHIVGPAVRAADPHGGLVTLEFGAIKRGFNALHASAASRYAKVNSSFPTLRAAR